MKKRHILVLVIFLLNFVVSGCELEIGKYNILARPPDPEISGSTEAKLMSAQDYLDKGKPEEAYNIYNEILAEEPDNSVALYGHAESLLKKEFGIANLIASIIAGSGSEDLISKGIPPIDIQKLREEILPVFFEDLKKIADGYADEIIENFDVDVNFTLGVFKFIEAAIVICDSDDDGDLWTQIRGGFGEISEVIKIDKNFEIHINTELLKSILLEIKAILLEKFDTAISLIEEGLHYLGISIDTAGLASRLKELQDGIDEFKQRLYEVRDYIDALE